jgi:hypothetical protein
MVSKRRFQDLVSSKTALIAEGRPNEGDILYLPLMNSFFEILFVEDQQPFFQLGNLPVYKLKVTPWEYSSEQLQTGVTAIDEKEQVYTLNQLDLRVTLEDSSVENYYLNHLKSSLVLEDNGLNNSMNYFLQETADQNVNSAYANNNEFDIEAGLTSPPIYDLLDFSETNPFGDPGAY